MIAVDTETTGLDLWHGCRPFMVAMLYDTGETRVYQWRVDPVTRDVTVEQDDIDEISERLNAADEIVFHNSKFDMLGLQLSGVELPSWAKVYDTILASHCLYSKGPHDLKDLALRHCDILDDDEKALKKACVDARRIGKNLGWRIAQPEDPHWPGIKTGKSWWAADMWMPREAFLSKEVNTKFHTRPEWDSLCATYCKRDVERTMGLWMYFKRQLYQKGLQEQYEVRRKNLEAVFTMENNGITLYLDKLDIVEEKHSRLSAEHEAKCKKIVGGRINNLESAQQLQSALYTTLKFPIIKTTPKSGQPSTDKDTLEALLLECDNGSPGEEFITNLMAYRKRSHAAESVTSYKRGCFPITGTSWLARLHASFNITGTDTTRYSSNNPNAQNISKGAGLPPELGFNLRELFGPLPGREWYTFDYSNIELRIFAHAAGETEFIEAFAAGESVHLIVAKELYPKEYAECERKGLSFKTVYEATLYQWTKNGNFSLIYGAGVRKADKTYHLPGAYARIRRRFKHIDRFMRAMHDIAREKGYITTLGGYQLRVPHDGPHKAVNFYVQGSAGFAMCLAMNRVHEYLKGFPDYRLIIQIHDELDTDFPVRPNNTQIANHICGLMAKSGDDLGVALPVEYAVIRDNWSQEQGLKYDKKMVAPLRIGSKT